ncbi:SDR family NAD(P)-dependent oxidoreductase [Mangrovitalea sediminis]|uniref:SDR family NAD(P)-dependent oxidoreductase n=1 Tax=Mangrovitalea sediminis TaxID=1982043 RepID=UPI000BE5DBA3|nr:SDR family oxidoreductase [Mangrovitalea sediminis]
MAEQKQQTVLITGASMGIGRDMALDLARRANHLILVARSEEALQQLATRLRTERNVEATVIALDLAQPDAADTLYQKVQALGLEVDVLVNNAGFGLKGAFMELPLADQQRMMQLNMGALTSLCYLFGRDMVRRGGGRILNVASVAAFQPGPLMAIYCATKAFVLSLSEALDTELRSQGVRVTALCPGAVDTHFHTVAKNDSKLLLGMAMQPAPVAKEAVRGLWRGQRIVIPGWMNRLTVFSVRLMPRRWVAGIAYRLIAG